MTTHVTDYSQDVGARRVQAARRYRYAMISSEIRGDLQGPLAYFRRLEIFHFYRSAPWNDMKAADFNDRTRRFRLPLDLLWSLWRVRPEIVQGPEPLSLLMLPFLSATLAYLWLNPRVPLITLSLEPLPLEHKYHRAVVPLYRAILRQWFRRASVIFWLDTASRDNLLANGAPPTKLQYLMYGSWGLDVDVFNPNGPAVHIDTTDPVILYVGRLDVVKGVTYVLDAFRSLLDGGTRAHLAIVGDGPERQHLQAKAEQLGIAERTTWFGTIKHADLPPYLRMGRMLVLPSISTRLWVQQLSQTAWQAMACGLPVIATRTGRMEEFTPPDVGVLVPEADSVSLARAIGDLLADETRRRELSRHARAYAVERFDARRNVEEAERVILESCTRTVVVDGVESSEA